MKFHDNIQSSRMANIVCSNRLKGSYLLIITVLGTYFMWYGARFYKSIPFINVDTTMLQKTRIFRPTFNVSLTLQDNITKWIVVTTIKYPTQDIEKLTKIKGWQVLVVGDLKTPKNWTYPGCVFLGINEQVTLGFRSTSNLPTNSYTRKMVGYLYAIQHGAKYIYDTDDDNYPRGGKINFFQEEFTSGLIYDDVTEDIMNPYAHFGQPSFWPRGFPLERVNKPNNNTYKLCTFKTPAIQQRLVNGDPDVDAISRLTRKEPNQRYINVTFDARAPPVTLPVGVFAPFNSQNTFFAYDAFWALFLPTSVAFRVTDIWRGYWAQSLLWLIGQRLSFFPPNAVQFRNSHDYLEDFKDENQFYTQTGSLIEFLKNWTCSASTFFQCVRHLGNEMAEGGFWAKADAEVLDSWLSDLMAIGYQEPEMNNATEECLKRNGKKSIQRVFFAPVVQDHQTQESGLRDINGFCDDYFNISVMERTASGHRINPKTVFEDVLLIIVFNFPFYANIRLLDALYYDHFPNIVYCGETKSHAQLTKDIDQGQFAWRQRQVSFVNITSNKGYFGYECAIRAVEMRYNVEGYLVLGDDIMFNFWNFEKNRNLNVAQLQLDGYRTVNRTTEQTSWSWWGSSVGKKPLEISFDELEIMASNNSNEIQKNLISEYLKIRNEANLNMSVVSFSVADLYYVPKSASEIFVEVMKVFLKNQVFLEIAIPSTIAGMNRNVSTNGFLGKSIWEGERKTPLKYFNATSHYVHPVKLSQLFSENATRDSYCHNYISQIFKHW